MTIPELKWDAGFQDDIHKSSSKSAFRNKHIWNKTFSFTEKLSWELFRIRNRLAKVMGIHWWLDLEKGIIWIGRLNLGWENMKDDYYASCKGSRVSSCEDYIIDMWIWFEYWWAKTGTVKSHKEHFTYKSGKDTMISTIGSFPNTFPKLPKLMFNGRIKQGDT